ncbi:MAG: CtsR family transcriptional regulator [Clostridia bacterium]|nr:CtsR family transcriptional regulator [Oscillospiraceae bacterium]MBP3600459.1 CtsR family transcriptional regulator [Clostridia bacterium]
MRMSDLITREIIRMLNESEENTAEIQRNEFAGLIGCAPSQINYVLSSRFTPEHGYIIESRRGGGGYIRIKRVMLNSSSAFMHIINSIGDSIDSMSTRIVIENCLEAGLISSEIARIMAAAVSNSVMQTVPPMLKDNLRATILKQMLLTQI